MTTLCVTVLVYISSYLGTLGWYRTVLNFAILEKAKRGTTSGKVR